MAESKVELRKLRDFGENFNDVFSFLRQNSKPLLRAFFVICGIFLLAHAIFNGIYQSQNIGILEQFRRVSNAPPTGTTDIPSVFTIGYFMAIFFGLLSYTAVVTMVGAYLKYYDEHRGEQPNVEQVWTIFRKYFMRVFIFSIPVNLLILVSVFFCCFPVFYFAVVLAPFGLIVVLEDLGFAAAFNRCFVIIKNNFWISLAIYLVAGLIYYVSSLIIAAVVGLAVGAASYFTTKDLGTTVGIVTSTLNIFSSLFSLILLLSIALNYFNLVEQFEGTGILRRVENLGNPESNNFDNIEEQY